LFALTRKTDYALAALTDMASNSRNGASARDLSERLHLPLRASPTF
jgi:DNA-binding IscR family transcriptional regulator